MNTVKIISIPADEILLMLAELKKQNESIKNELEEIKKTANDKKPQAEKLISMKEAANRLNISISTLFELINSNNLPFVFRAISEQNKKQYCRESELNKFIENNWKVKQN